MPSDATSGGLPARQLFAPGADAILRLVLWSIVVVIVAGGAMALTWSYGDFVGNVGVAPAQPVPFSHKHHSGELGLDCRNCHEQVTHEVHGRAAADAHVHDVPFADLDRLFDAGAGARQPGPE